MRRLTLHRLNPAQRKKLQALIALCCNAEPIRLSVPLPPVHTDLTDECFFVLYDHGQMVSAAHLFYPDQTVGELIGYTHPDFRKRGYFGKLLSLACDYAEEIGLEQIYLISDGCSADAAAATRVMGLEAAYTEYMLVKELTAQPFHSNTAQKPDAWAAVEKPHASPSRLSIRETTDPDLIASLLSPMFSYGQEQTEALVEEITETPSIHSHVLYLDRLPVGQAQLTVVKDMAYLSGFGILPQYRRQGFGHQFLQLLETHLIKQGITRLTLQVSSQNPGAYELYRKCGFSCLEALHYFPLFE